MTEEQQFIDTIKEVLKPKEPTSSNKISVTQMIDKLERFKKEAETKIDNVNEMFTGYINTRNPSDSEIARLKIEVNNIFEVYKKSFNN